MAQNLLLVTLVVAVAMTTPGRLVTATECDVALKEDLDNLVIDVSYKFKAVKQVDGTYLCPSDTPAVSLPLGVWIGVGGPARCALFCKDMAGCVSFNYRTAPLADGTQCQLFTTAPTSCSNSDQNCRHYEDHTKSSSCKNTADFTYSAQNKAFYKPIYEKMTWKNAQKKCKEISQFAHLLTFQSALEYDNFVKLYLPTLPADQTAKCVEKTLNGFWLAKRRVEYSCSKGWMWDILDSEVAALPELTWESSKWWSGQPDCYGGTERCVHMLTSQSNLLNDHTCDTLVFCPLCQING